MKRDSGMLAATCFAGARHVCPARFVGAVCLRRLVSLILLRAALLSAAENRVRDREKENEYGVIDLSIDHQAHFSPN